MMASYIYSIRIKTTSPIVEEDVEDAFEGLFLRESGERVQITEFDLEDAEYSEV